MNKTHAPSDLRDAFETLVPDLIAHRHGTPLPTTRFRDRDVPASELCGMLWNCRDQAPRDLVRDAEELGHVTGASFGALARVAMRFIRRSEAHVAN